MSRINVKLPQSTPDNSQLSKTKPNPTPVPDKAGMCYTQWSNYDDWSKNGRRGDFCLSMQNGRYWVNYVDQDGHHNYKDLTPAEFEELKNYNGSYWG